MSPTGIRSPDYAVTANIMSQCASSEITGDLPLCILDNHGLQASVSTQQALLYSNIDSLWDQFDHDVPVGFQTFSPTVDLCQTMGWDRLPASPLRSGRRGPVSQDFSSTTPRN